MSNQLQHRLFHFEVEPPARMWEAITDALEDQTSSAADKLQQFEAVPKAAVWDKIEENLNVTTDTQPHQIPSYKRLSKPLRYGSAVAILVLVAVAIFLFTNKDMASGNLAQQPGGTLPAQNQSNTVKASTTTPKPDRSSQSTGSGKGNGTRVDRQTYNSDSENETSTTQKAASERYLTVATEEGTSVRLSKKVFPVFDCAEHSTAIKRFQCKENIEALQKMASSLASPSGDFASLMDMIKTLEENR